MDIVRGILFRALALGGAGAMIVVLAACGQKGPLYIAPPASAASAPAGR